MEQYFIEHYRNSLKFESNHDDNNICRIFFIIEYYYRVFDWLKQKQDKCPIKVYIAAGKQLVNSFLSCAS